ncbi:hypothetical protein BHE74_00002477 [Ensete ventricosum]|nr:hypothetical protein BHE74_00002477 [Ensete ventricosum]
MSIDLWVAPVSFLLSIADSYSFGPSVAPKKTLLSSLPLPFLLLHRRRPAIRGQQLRFVEHADCVLWSIYDAFCHTVSVKWQKEVFPAVEIDTSQPPLVFKCQLYALTGVPPERQKIMVKGGLLKDDADWATLGVKEVFFS